jgi:hypothetical protein
MPSPLTKPTPFFLFFPVNHDNTKLVNKMRTYRFMDVSKCKFYESTCPE